MSFWFFAENLLSICSSNVIVASGNRSITVYCWHFSLLLMNELMTSKCYNVTNVHSTPRYRNIYLLNIVLFKGIQFFIMSIRVKPKQGENPRRKHEHRKPIRACHNNNNTKKRRNLISRSVRGSSDTFFKLKGYPWAVLRLLPCFVCFRVDCNRFLLNVFTMSSIRVVCGSNHSFCGDWLDSSVFKEWNLKPSIVWVRGVTLEVDLRWPFKTRFKPQY